MRQGVAIGAALIALTVPATASAQTPCSVPKGWSTAQSQLEYEMYREIGLATMRIQRYVPPAGSIIDMQSFVRRLPQNATEIGVGSVESGFYVAAAGATYAVNMLTATAAEPPSCGTRKRRR